MFYIVVWGLAAITASILGGILAGMKNRDYSAWAAWCFVLPPLVIALLLTPKNTGPRPRRPTLDEIDAENDRTL
jgi:nucleoside permease NupC